MKINLKYFKFLKEDRKNYLILFTVITCAVFPAFVITHLLTRDYSVIMPKPNFAQEGNVFALATVGILLALVTPLIMFNYKNSKRSIDLIHSLPITRKNLLLINMLVGTLLVIIPVTISYWSGYALLYIFDNYKYTLMHLTHYLKIVLMLIVIMIPSLFISMNVGTLFDALIYTGIAIVLPFIAYFSFTSFSSAYVFGFSNNGFLNLNYISPLVALYRQINFSGESDVINLIYWLIIGSLFFILSIILYIKWPSEVSEKPISNRFFFPIVVSIVTFISLVFLISIMNYPSNARYQFLSIQNLLIAILISFAIYASLSVLQSRSIKNFKTIVINYLRLLVLSLSLLFVFTTTNGFFTANKIPTIDNIKKVTVQSMNSNSNIFITSNPYEFHDHKTISELIEFQEAIINYHKEDLNFFNLNKNSKVRDDYIENLKINDRYQLDSDSVKITYQLSRNRKVVREYHIFNAFYKELSDLVNNDVVINVNHPITNPNTKAKDIKIFNNSMTKNLLIDKSVQIQDKIISDLKSINLNEQNSEIKYVLQYETSREHGYNYYNFLIDERFAETINFIENNLIKENKTDFSFYILPIEENEFLYTYSQKLIQNSLYFDTSSISITREEIFNKKPMFVNNPDESNMSGALMIDSDYDSIILPYK